MLKSLAPRAARRHAAGMTVTSQHQTNIETGRHYFTMMDRVKDAVQVPWKHVTSFFEPGGKDYES